jgi:hypothetical protein
LVGHTVGHLPFEAVGRRSVVDVPGHLVRSVLLADPSSEIVVGVLVAVSVADLGGPLITGVAKVNWDPALTGGSSVDSGPAQSHGHPVGLG